MLYSCTHMTTVGVKGLDHTTHSLVHDDNDVAFYGLPCIDRGVFRGLCPPLLADRNF